MPEGCSLDSILLGAQSELSEERLSRLERQASNQYSKIHHLNKQLKIRMPIQKQTWPKSEQVECKLKTYLLL